MKVKTRTTKPSSRRMTTIKFQNSQLICVKTEPHKKKEDVDDDDDEKLNQPTF